MRIVVVSDSHGHTDILRKIIKTCSPFDMIIHCGDGVRDICSAEIPGNSMVLKVMGNTDLNSGCDADHVITEEISGKKVFVAHGHQFDVKSGYSRIVNEAVGLNAGVVLFGHTHEQYIRKGKPVLFNPGNLSGGNYGIIHAEPDKEWSFEHRKIKKV